MFGDNKEPHRRSEGNVREPGDGYLPNGNPDLSPAAGYEAAKPRQYDDESDTQFAKRVEDFETRRSHAEDIQNASGATQDSYEGRLKSMEERHEKERKALEMARDAGRFKEGVDINKEA